MEKVLNVAQFIINEYKAITGTSIDEMKLHKLLYFAERENIAIMGEPMFPEPFEGWKYGPVCRLVRSNFDVESGQMNCDTESVSDESAYIIKNVIITYGEYASWKLSKMTHSEVSWINSRKGLGSEDNGSVEISIEDIKKDAEKVRPYDHTWDMYYDEFEDAEVL